MPVITHSSTVEEAATRIALENDAREAVSRAVWLTRRKKYIPALEIFEENLGRCGHDSDSPVRARALSFYGLCLAMVWGHVDRARYLCEAAIAGCPPDADLLFNLGMVRLRQRRRGDALEAFRRGLAVDESHVELQATLDRLRPRRQPLFPFLERRHALNKYAGLLRHRVTHLWSAGDPIASIPTHI
ncbi:MAG: hypothetical protein ACE5IK_00405 [Acidobacteriota bacterium]